MSDSEGLSELESIREGTRPATAATQRRREIPPVALTMQALAQAEAAARAYDANALALAVEMSLAEERNVAE